MHPKSASLEDRISALRAKVVDVPRRRVLVTNYTGTAQERDLTEPPNCSGFGRIRHFRRRRDGDWPSNPLPIDPAIEALGLDRTDSITAQVFQVSACAWRCWYCYVPYELLIPNNHHAAWLTPDDLLDMMLKEDAPHVIDLSGGQPDLVPEWPIWWMESLQRRGLSSSYYVWTDDNLGSNLLLTTLTGGQIRLLTNKRRHGRVCCLKGVDESSFEFNTGQPGREFAATLDRLEEYVRNGLDPYCYLTLTTREPLSNGQLAGFLSRLEAISPTLPSRIVPLKIDEFSPTIERLDDVRRLALANQRENIGIWQQAVGHT